MIGQPGRPVEKENVTFLGVETAPVSETLGTQLGLARDSGLVVMQVVPGSPAENVLKQHDVLLKLDDQLLVEPRQFSVLIRNHKEGDEVTFTFIRAGKQATAKVKLAKHEVPKGNVLFITEPRGRGNAEAVMTYSRDAATAARADADRVLRLVEQGVPREPVRGTVGFRATNVNIGNSNMVFSDDHGSLDLTIKDGKKTLVAKNPKGEQVFSGPVNTVEERRALPQDVRERLDRIEGMQGFSFRTDDQFVPAARTLQASPQTIRLRVDPELGERPLSGAVF